MKTESKKRKERVGGYIYIVSTAKKRTAFFCGMESVLPWGDDGAAEAGADTVRAPGKKRDMRVLRDKPERVDCGVDGAVDVIVVDDAVERPGSTDEDDAETIVLGFFSEDRAGGGGNGTVAAGRSW